MEAIINSILSQMQTLLSGRQLKSLENVLISTLGNQGCGTAPSVEEDLLSLFPTAKEVEGCSPRRLHTTAARLSTWPPRSPSPTPR